MALLSIIQDVTDEIGLPRPEAVISSTDASVRQLLRLANKEGQALARRANWQRLKKEATFTTTDSHLQTALSTVASDFGKYLNDSMWDRTTDEKVRGPLDETQWQALVASPVQAQVGYQFRIWQNGIHFYPAPATGVEDDIYFEYMSSHWCISAASATQARWVADTDLGLLDEELMTLGIIWRFKKAKGLDYGEEFDDYERALETLLGYDGGKETVDFTGQLTDLFTVNIPEGSWNV